jgi:hypothetical protein
MDQAKLPKVDLPRPGCKWLSLDALTTVRLRLNVFRTVELSHDNLRTASAFFGSIEA